MSMSAACRRPRVQSQQWHSPRPCAACFLSSSSCLLSGSVATAAPVAFQDTMAQRTLACTSCHGKEGRAGPDGYYPRIAGKPAGYLYAQLLHFREGAAITA